MGREESHPFPRSPHLITDFQDRDLDPLDTSAGYIRRRDRKRQNWIRSRAPAASRPKLKWCWRQITRQESRERRRKTGSVGEMAVVPPVPAVSACLPWRYVRQRTQVAVTLRWRRQRRGIRPRIFCVSRRARTSDGDRRKQRARIALAAARAENRPQVGAAGMQCRNALQKISAAKRSSVCCRTDSRASSS